MSELYMRLLVLEALEFSTIYTPFVKVRLRSNGISFYFDGPGAEFFKYKVKKKINYTGKTYI